MLYTYMHECYAYGIACVFVELRPSIAEAQGGVFKLESTTTEIANTLSNITAVVNGWKSGQDKLANQVHATAEHVVLLQKEMVQLRSEVAAKSIKRVHSRSRSPLSRCCHCSFLRFDRKIDNKLQKGDEVWPSPRHGGRPTVKRYIFATNGRSSELSNDKAGRVRCGDFVRNENLFIKSVCHFCRRRR